MASHKRREPGSFAEAACKIRDRFTADGAAGIIGMSPTRVDQACDPDRSNYCPFTLAQALALDVTWRQTTGQEGPLFIAYRNRYREQTAPFEERDVEPMHVIGDVSSNAAQIVKSLIEAHAPDSDGGEDVTKQEAIRVVADIDALARELEGYRRHYAKIGGISPDMRPVAVKRINDNQSAA